MGKLYDLDIKIIRFTYFFVEEVFGLNRLAPSRADSSSGRMLLLDGESFSFSFLLSFSFWSLVRRPRLPGLL